MMNFGRLAIGLVLTTMAAGCSAGSPQAASVPPAKPSGAASVAAPITFRYGLSGTGGATTIFRLANDLNLWGQEGLKAEFTQFQGDPLGFAAVQAGELDFFSGGADAGVSLALKGAPIRIIALVQNKFEYHLLAGKDIRSAQDLKGKAVAVSKIGSNSDFATREALKRLGIDPASVTYVQAGNSVQRAAALESGAVQGSIMSPDFVVRLTDAGFRDLADMSKMDLAFPFMSIGTTTQLLESRSDLAQRVLRAVYRGIKQFRDDPAAAQKIISEQSGETRKEVLQTAWETYTGVFANDITPDPQVFTELLKELSETEPKAKDARPEAYLDQRPARQVNASGFPQQLQGK